VTERSERKIETRKKKAKRKLPRFVTNNLGNKNEGRNKSKKQANLRRGRQNQVEPATVTETTQDVVVPTQTPTVPPIR
jgi:hypothetical protein